MRLSRYIIPLMISAAAVSCTVQEISSPEYSCRLKIRAASGQMDGTKSIINLGSDMVYAYPFGLEGNFQDVNGLPIAASSIIGEEYSFYMPQPSQDILFTNIIDGNGGYSITAPYTADTLMKITVRDNMPGSDYDLVTGTLPASETDPDNPSVYPVHLSRKVAQITLNFRVKQKNNEELIQDLSQFFSKVTVSVPTYSTLCIPSMTDNAGVYYGEVTSTWSSESIPQASGILLADGCFVFPSTGGSNAEFSLTAVSPTGNTISLNSSLSSMIEANKHYDLTLTLRQRSDAFDFEVESFIMDTIAVDLDYTDLVVTPSLDIEMTRTAENLDNTPPFRLGEDTLYCYPFMTDEADTLAAGYPKPQTAIVNGRYIFSIPKGTQNIIFSNINLTDGVSDYLFRMNSGIDNDPLTYNDNLCIRMRDLTLLASDPLILGRAENITPDQEGIRIDLPLKQVSTGYRVLLDITTEDDATLSSVLDNIQNYWLVANEYCSDYNIFHEYDEYYTRWNYCTYTSEPYTIDDLKEVTYNGRPLLQVSGFNHILLNPEMSGTGTISIYVLTDAGETMVFRYAYDVYDLFMKNNTVIMRLNSSDFTD